MRALDPPLSEMLVAARVKAAVIVGIESDTKDRVVARISEGNRSLLPPEEDLHREGSIHSDRNEFPSISRKGQVENPALVGGTEDHKRLHGVGIPDVDQRLDVHLPCRNNAVPGVLGDAGDLQLVALVESLHPPVRVQDNPDPRRVVGDVLLAGNVHGIVVDWLLLLQLVCVASAEDSRKDVVKGLLLGDPGGIHVLEVENPLLPQIEVDALLLRFIVEVHVHQRVALVRDEDAVDVLQDQADRGRPLPDLLLIVKVELGVDGVDGLVVAASHEDRLVVDLVGFPLLDLEAVVQLENQSLVLLRIEDDLLDSVALRELIQASFQVDLGLLVKDGLQLELAHALVQVAQRDDPLVVYGELKLLDIGGVALEVAAHVLLDALDIFPDIDVAIFISSDHDVAEIAESDRHHRRVDGLRDQGKFADPRAPKALGDILGLVLQQKRDRIEDEELPLVGVDHDLRAVLREVQRDWKAVVELAGSKGHVVPVRVFHEVDALVETSSGDQLAILREFHVDDGFLAADVLPRDELLPVLPDDDLPFLSAGSNHKATLV